MSEKYVLPKLNYGFKDLEPHISEEQLKLHYEKHHQAYVDAANSIVEMIEKSRKEDADLDMKSVLKSFSFNLAGHKLHSRFWENLTPKKEEPSGKLKEAIVKEFGSFDRFKKEFTQAAVSCEGSGWAVLTYGKRSKRMIIMQIEKHNVNIIPSYKILLCLDVWEHAYYLDYKNARAKFVEAFWNIVNWKVVEQRFEELMKLRIK